MPRRAIARRNTASSLILKLQPADIADAATVTDDQIREDFEKRKDSYRTPETRTIEQLTFARTRISPTPPKPR